MVAERHGSRVEIGSGSGVTGGRMAAHGCSVAGVAGAERSPADTVTLVVTSLSASQSQTEGVRMAAALLLMIPSVLVYLGLQRLFERGMLSGSLKGRPHGWYGPGRAAGPAATTHGGDIMTKRRTAAVMAVLGMATVLGACGNGGSSPKPGVSGLVKLATGVHTGTRTCPVPYDLAKAAGKAGAPGTARPVTGDDAVTADTEKAAEPGSLLRKNGGAVLTCDYLLGSETVRIVTVGTRKTGTAIPMVLPEVQRDAGMASGQVTSYFQRVHSADPGAATVTPSGNVAIVGLRSGSGDLAVVVSLGDDGHTSLSTSQVRTLAATLAGQADWPDAK